jgi:hypothetical protein
LFIEQTSEIPDLRLLKIQELLIDFEVAKAKDIDEVDNSELLGMWFDQLTMTGEAE